MNHGDFNRDPVESDAFFGELADMIDLVDAMTHERLGNGELDRRRNDIMDRVRRRKAAHQADDTAAPAKTAAAAPPAIGELGIGKPIVAGQDRTIARAPFSRVSASPSLDEELAGPVMPTRMFTVEARAALTDADRYRDSALQRAAQIVKEAQQEADDIRAEAQRIIEQAHQTAATITDPGRTQADRTVGVDSSATGRPAPTIYRPDGSRLKVMGPLAFEPSHALAELVTNAWDSGRSWQRLAFQRLWTAVDGMTDTGFLHQHLTGDAGRDVVLSTELGDPLLVWQCKLDTLSRTPRSPRLDPKHLNGCVWPSQDRVGLYAQALYALLTCSEASQGRLADAVHQLRTAEIDTWNPSRRRTYQRRVQPVEGASAVAAGSIALVSAALQPVAVAVRSVLSPVAGAIASLPMLSPVPRLLLACDVESPPRVDAALRSRWGFMLRQILGDAVAEAGLDSNRWIRQSRSGGELAILPTGTLSTAVVENLLTALDRQLREHNRWMTDGAQLRLRVAVHEGVVASDMAHGLSGQAVDDVSRLVDAPSLKQTLSRFPNASMAVAVSDPVYQDVVAHRSAIRRDQYRRMTLPQVPGTPVDAWLSVLDDSLPGWDDAGDSAGKHRSPEGSRMPSQNASPAGAVIVESRT